MSLEEWSKVSDIIDHVVVSIAAVVGGVWVVSRLNRERTDEAALEMVVSTMSSLMSSQNLVLITIQLTNKGKTKIEVKTERDKDGYIFNDGYEFLKHACSLQIRQFDSKRATQSGSLDWFEGGPWTDLPVKVNETQINVLLEYENPKKAGLIEFWMEPGEVYRLGVPVLLPEGVYIAKLTFVGADQERDWLDRILEEFGILPTKTSGLDENFWSQVFGFSVPATPTPAPAKTN